MNLSIEQVNKAYFETLNKEGQISALKNAGLNTTQAKSFLKTHKIKAVE